MYFFAVWIFTNRIWNFTNEECPVFKTDLSRKEWKKRLKRANEVPHSIDDESDCWKFFYTGTGDKFIDAWEWSIPPTLYLTEKLAREAAFKAYQEKEKHQRRSEIRNNSKRTRIFNKMT